MHHTVLSSITGFLSSLLLTLLAFTIVSNPAFFNLGAGQAATFILILAVIQSIVQSVFFLKLLSEKGTRWNLFVFGSTISILLIIVFFSIWIMHHLNYNMMGLKT